jgi:transposase
MYQSHIVALSKKERDFLIEHCKKGDWTARVIIRAKILLLADQNADRTFSDPEIAEMLNISLSSVRYRRKRFSETKNIEDTLFDNSRSGRPTIIDGAIDAHMTTIACSEAPEGHAKWSLRLIRDRMVALDIIDSISHMTVGRVLKKKKSNHG